MRISDWSSDVCSSDLIRLHDDPPLAIFAADLVGTIGHANVGDALKRHEPPIRQRHRHLTERLQIGARHIRQADGDGEAPISFEDHAGVRSEEHTSELQSLMRISYAVFCLKKKNTTQTYTPSET